MISTTRRPIEYVMTLDIRFGDLDPYGHLNAKHYLDIIASTRLLVLEREIHLSVNDIIQRGFAFYLRKATQNFKRPIIGMVSVLTRSHVASIDSALLTIPYEITTPDGSHIYADGVLEYTVVDAKTGRPTAPPDWLVDCFFYKEGE